MHLPAFLDESCTNDWHPATQAALDAIPRWDGEYPLGLRFYMDGSSRFDQEAGIGLEQQPLSFLLTQWLGNGLVDFKVAQSHSQLPPHLLKLEHSYRPFYGQTHFSTNVDVHTASLSHSMGMPLVRVTLLKAYGYHRRTNQLPMDAVI